MNSQSQLAVLAAFNAGIHAHPPADDVLDGDARHCPYGTAGHSQERVKRFSRCEGSYLFDAEDRRYLDLQMWYSAAHFGYANPNVGTALNGGAYCVDRFAGLFESGIRDPKPAEYAAFYVESPEGIGSYVIPPPGCFRKLETLLDACRVLLVDDDIQMGFFRAGKLWAIDNFSVRPDVIVFGKAVTDGSHPLAGLWARDEVIGTYARPHCPNLDADRTRTAIGHETMTMLSERDYMSMTRAKGAYFLEGLKELQRRHAIVGDIDGAGLALRLEICGADGITPATATADRMRHEALKADLQIGSAHYGLVLAFGGRHGNVLTLAPSTAISRAEIDLAIMLLDRLLTRVSM